MPLIATVTLLTGCSPHPGSGTWMADGKGENPFTELRVHFDGRAEFMEGESERLRCFWAGEDRESIRLDCTAASDPEATLSYQLRVTERGGGRLIQDGRPAGTFIRKP